MRSECPGYKCEERPACEEHVAGGPLHVVSLDGQPCEQVAPTMFLARAGQCKLCNAAETVCSEPW
jgi:hypothetical protein